MCFTLISVGCGSDEPVATPSFGDSATIKFWPIPRNFTGNEASEITLQDDFRFTRATQMDTSVHVSRLLEATAIVNSHISNLLERFHELKDGSPSKTSSCSLIVDNPGGQMSDNTSSESYTISFRDAEGSCYIKCETAYGCIRGLFTFLQMIDPVKKFKVPALFEINDQPAFSHRGLLLDTGRHFIPASMIEDHIRVMASVKMNVLHWHITEDPSFPLALEGDNVKRLGTVGSFHPSRAVYTKSDVKRIVDLASSLGIRVIPEIDIPAHTTSWWRAAYPELQGRAKGALDPTREENYAFIESVLTEVIEWFQQDIYEGPPVIHLGGDKIWEAWNTDAIMSWMRNNEMTSMSQLVQYWFSRIMGIAKKLGVKVIMWEDFLSQTGDSIQGFGDNDNPIIFETWLRNVDDTIKLADTINRNVIFSGLFYLDYLNLAWTDFYRINLNSGTKNVRFLGAEACMWGEWVDETNMFPRTWPRAAAVAERLWCGPRCNQDPSVNAILRMAKWRCRMVNLFGYNNIEPVGNEKPASPDVSWVYGTDKTQWWCDEASL